MVEYENERGQYREGSNREVPKQYEDEVVKGRTNKSANGKGQFNEGPINKGPLDKGRSGAGPNTERPNWVRTNWEYSHLAISSTCFDGFQPKLGHRCNMETLIC